MPTTSLTFDIDDAGIVAPDYADILSYLQYKWAQIYGTDLTQQPSSSPDNQALNIFTQIIFDNLQLIIQVNSGFSPDQAFGTTLDWRVAYNGIQRQGGTFSITNLTIVIDTPGTSLPGLDQTSQLPFTVSDASGTQWNLLSTQNFASAGTYTNISFQAAVPGDVSSLENTITQPVTVVVGVASFTNPALNVITGVDEESDAALRIRRQQSVAIGSQGYLNGLTAALLNITGVTYAFVYENTTASTDGNGVPGHSIWVIVAGDGANADIANAIYIKRNAGAGMFGSTSFPIAQSNGSTFTVFWDTVVLVPLFIKFTATALDGATPPNITAITTNLSSVYKPGVAATVNVNDLATAVREIDSNTLVSTAGFSTTSGGSYTTTLTPASKKNQFEVISTDVIILAPYLTCTGCTFVFTGGAVTNITVSIVHPHTVQFTMLGGYSTRTWSKTNVSGTTGSINSSTGLYTAGAGAGVDTVTGTDALGNAATGTVTVT